MDRRHTLNWAGVVTVVTVSGGLAVLSVIGGGVLPSPGPVPGPDGPGQVGAPPPREAGPPARASPETFWSAQARVRQAAGWGASWSEGSADPDGPSRAGSRAGDPDRRYRGGSHADRSPGAGGGTGPDPGWSGGGGRPGGPGRPPCPPDPAPAGAEGRSEARTPSTRDRSGRGSERGRTDPPASGGSKRERHGGAERGTRGSGDGKAGKGDKAGDGKAGKRNKTGDGKAGDGRGGKRDKDGGKGGGGKGGGGKGGGVRNG